MRALCARGPPGTPAAATARGVGHATHMQSTSRPSHCGTKHRCRSPSVTVVSDAYIQPPRAPPREARVCPRAMHHAHTASRDSPSLNKTRSTSPHLKKKNEHHCTLHRSFLSKRFSGKHTLRLRAHVSLHVCSWSSRRNYANVYRVAECRMKLSLLVVASEDTKRRSALSSSKSCLASLRSARGRRVAHLLYAPTWPAGCIRAAQT